MPCLIRNCPTISASLFRSLVPDLACELIFDIDMDYDRQGRLTDVVTIRRTAHTRGRCRPAAVRLTEQADGASPNVGGEGISKC
jgi:hypothetical protein